MINREFVAKVETDAQVGRTYYGVSAVDVIRTVNEILEAHVARSKSLDQADAHILQLGKLLQELPALLKLTTDIDRVASLILKYYTWLDDLTVTSYLRTVESKRRPAKGLSREFILASDGPTQAADALAAGVLGGGEVYGRRARKLVRDRPLITALELGRLVRDVAGTTGI